MLSNPRNDAFIYAGDGDDEVDIDGEGWYGTIVYGGEGDDTFTVNSGFTDPTAGGTNMYGSSVLSIYGG